MPRFELVEAPADWEEKERFYVFLGSFAIKRTRSKNLAKRWVERLNNILDGKLK